jgi:sigma54-dependent transcription regulator
MSLRDRLSAAKRRQPFASRASLEATAADLRVELAQLRAETAELRAELDQARAAIEANRTEAARLAGRLDLEARQAWAEVATSGRAWGGRLLDLEAAVARLAAAGPPPAGNPAPDPATGHEHTAPA